MAQKNPHRLQWGFAALSLSYGTDAGFGLFPGPDRMDRFSPPEKRKNEMSACVSFVFLLYRLRALGYRTKRDFRR